MSDQNFERRPTDLPELATAVNPLEVLACSASRGIIDFLLTDRLSLRDSISRKKLNYSSLRSINPLRSKQQNLITLEHAFLPGPTLAIHLSGFLVGCRESGSESRRLPL